METTIKRGSQQPTNAGGIREPCENYDEFFKIGKENRVFAFCCNEEYWQEKGHVADAFSQLEECFDLTEESKNKIRVVLCHYNTLLERHLDVLHKSQKYEKEQE